MDSKVDIRLTSNLELLGEVLRVEVVGSETGTASTVVLASASGSAARCDIAEILCGVEWVAGVGTDGVKGLASVVTSWAARVRRRIASLLRVWLGLVLGHEGGGLIVSLAWLAASGGCVVRHRSRLIGHRSGLIRDRGWLIGDRSRLIRNRSAVVRDAGGAVKSGAVALTIGSLSGLIWVLARVVWVFASVVRICSCLVSSLASLGVGRPRRLGSIAVVVGLVLVAALRARGLGGGGGLLRSIVEIVEPVRNGAIFTIVLALIIVIRIGRLAPVVDLAAYGAEDRANLLQLRVVRLRLRVVLGFFYIRSGRWVCLLLVSGFLGVRIVLGRLLVLRVRVGHGRVAGILGGRFGLVRTVFRIRCRVRVVRVVRVVRIVLKTPGRALLIMIVIVAISRALDRLSLVVVVIILSIVVAGISAFPARWLSVRVIIGAVGVVDAVGIVWANVRVGADGQGNASGQLLNR